MTEPIRIRIKELRRVPAKDLKPHPKNWRRHPAFQREALRGVLEEVGYAGALLARETPDGLELIDGHLRAETTPDQEVPVLVLDVSEQEADFLLATIDPLVGLAVTDIEALQTLIENTNGLDQNLLDMLDENLILGEEETTESGSIALNKNRFITVVLYCAEVGRFEEAMARTGLTNRAEAFMEICEAYLNAAG